ncbi:hypothetical protein HanRHA438_Chr14g0643561 [Helianthus annuus]|nr:hypothetical protein HanRHA438_Chr14g0643561 [Helianthus annuus]
MRWTKCLNVPFVTSHTITERITVVEQLKKENVIYFDIRLQIMLFTFKNYKKTYLMFANLNMLYSLTLT